MKLSSLDPCKSIDLQYLGVCLPLPPKLDQSKAATLSPGGKLDWSLIVSACFMFFLKTKCDNTSFMQYITMCNSTILVFLLNHLVLSSVQPVSQTITQESIYVDIFALVEQKFLSSSSTQMFWQSTSCCPCYQHCPWKVSGHCADATKQVCFNSHYALSLSFHQPSYAACTVFISQQDTMWSSHWVQILNRVPVFFRELCLLEIREKWCYCMCTALLIYYGI